MADYWRLVGLVNLPSLRESGSAKWREHRDLWKSRRQAAGFRETANSSAQREPVPLENDLPTPNNGCRQRAWVIDEGYQRQIWPYTIHHDDVARLVSTMRNRDSILDSVSLFSIYFKKISCCRLVSFRDRLKQIILLSNENKVMNLSRSIFGTFKWDRVYNFSSYCWRIIGVPRRCISW